MEGICLGGGSAAVAAAQSRNFADGRSSPAELEQEQPLHRCAARKAKEKARKPDGFGRGRASFFRN